MTPIIMKGKPVADACRETIMRRIAAAKERRLTVTLAIVLVGDDPASHAYKNRLVRLLEEMGGAAKVFPLPADTLEEEVLQTIKRLNRNRYVTGTLPMMPMPKHINGRSVGAAVSPNKDVDCLNPQNLGDVFKGRSPWAACTPRACMAVLDYYGIDPAGKKAVVIGRSDVVGKPAALLLMQKNATVTICHSRTKDVAEYTREADIVLSAVGKAGFVTADMVREGAVLVDVGTNYVDGKLVGDVDPAAYARASAYTPVPGGIGVVSNMMVMDALTRHL